MTKSHFVLEKLCPVNPKKNTKSYTILALNITIDYTSIYNLNI